jgi:dephospho-CoA kinase
MNKPKCIGITGGIGSGKSTIAKIFNILGIPVYNADDEAKRLMVDDPDITKAIIDTFGEKSYINGILNRQWLAKEVFGSQDATDKINKIVHPAVARHFEGWALKQSTPYILKEAALLFESGSYKQLDQTILVTAPLELRVQRIKQRDPQRSEKQIQAIIAKQMDVEQAKVIADHILQNDDKQLLIPQIVALHQTLCQ